MAKLSKSMIVAVFSVNYFRMEFLKLTAILVEKSVNANNYDVFLSKKNALSELSEYALPQLPPISDVIDRR